MWNPGLSIIFLGPVKLDSWVKKTLVTLLPHLIQDCHQERNIPRSQSRSSSKCWMQRESKDRCYRIWKYIILYFSFYLTQAASWHSSLADSHKLHKVEYPYAWCCDLYLPHGTRGIQHIAHDLKRDKVRVNSQRSGIFQQSEFSIAVV